MPVNSAWEERAAAGDGPAVLSLGPARFQEANDQVRRRLAAADSLVLRDVLAQRYLGCALPAGKRLSIHGTPGNGMGAYLDGGIIEVFGNAQDQIGDTMDSGTIAIHGRCGDAAGYAMRGGSILVRDDCGWRAGINMKQYGAKRPAIVIGGDAGSFLGEYMAGGTILLCGRPGPHLATGMHGGVIYLAQPPDAHAISDGLVLMGADGADRDAIAELLGAYRAHFGGDGIGDLPEPDSFSKLVPASSRPYAALYAS